MTLVTRINRLQLHRRVNYCFLCSKPNTNLDNSTVISPEEETQDNVAKRKYTTIMKKRLEEMKQFFTENPSAAPYTRFLPVKVLESRPNKDPQYFYLVCPNIGKAIAEQVIQRLQGKNQVIAETNPGFGLITMALLEKGVPSVRLYEMNTEFQEYLQEAFNDSPYNISLYKKDYFKLCHHAYVDNLDQGQRVSELLKGVPKKSWSDDPFMTVVGTITEKTFLNYLVKSIVLQREPTTYGRIDLFLITYEKHWKIFTVTKDNARLYKSTSILMQLFFEAELIDKYPRKFFLPWQSIKKKKKKTSYVQDTDHLYLIKVTMRKEFPIRASDFVPFYCFMTILYGNGRKSIIGTCEKWIPGCGKNLILPTLDHENYLENIDIFTKFKELSPMQLVAVYREIASHPEFLNSPFMDMVEQEWLKSETIDTAVNDFHNKSPV